MNWALVVSEVVGAASRREVLGFGRLRRLVLLRRSKLGIASPLGRST
ncbi:MAG: hypothetical protein ACYTX0_08625 [Nostoc sp.]